jgi:hypothetical protein
MSKKPKLVIKTDSKNGAENIKASRDATNAQNLNQDKDHWLKAINLDDNNFVKTFNKNGVPQFQAVFHNGYTKAGKSKKPKKDDGLCKILQKMANQIWRMNAIKFGLTSMSDVELWMIKQKIQAILNADPDLIQLDYCRNSTRQSIDEEVQKETLAKYCPGVMISKPKNGSLTLANGKIGPKTKGEREMSTPRSIDLTAKTKNGIMAYLFCKYAGPVGSVTSVLQVDETNSFLEEAILYCKQNPASNAKFIAVVDGYAGEQHLASFNEQVKDYTNIFAGNCEQVIDWLNALDK